MEIRAGQLLSGVKTPNFPFDRGFASFGSQISSTMGVARGVVSSIRTAFAFLANANRIMEGVKDSIGAAAKVLNDAFGLGIDIGDLPLEETGSRVASIQTEVTEATGGALETIEALASPLLEAITLLSSILNKLTSISGLIDLARQEFPETAEHVAGWFDDALSPSSGNWDWFKTMAVDLAALGLSVNETMAVIGLRTGVYPSTSFIHTAASLGAGQSAATAPSGEAGLVMASPLEPKFKWVPKPDTMEKLEVWTPKASSLEIWSAQAGRKGQYLKGELLASSSAPINVGEQSLFRMDCRAGSLSGPVLCVADKTYLVADPTKRHN